MATKATTISSLSDLLHDYYIPYDINMTTTPIKKVKPPKPMKFEGALTALRKGDMARRSSWHSHSRIFRAGESVFVILPDFVSGGIPAKWAPYPHDILATDWQVTK